jgi:D-galactose 1-dehydrogenase
MYNIGIAGLGHVAVHQVAALAKMDVFNLVAVCDPDPGRLALLGEGRNTFTDIAEMLSLPELDVVVVATPNRLHVDHGVQTLESGKWLVMEKPVAETQEGFEKVENARDLCGGHCTLALHAAFGQEVEWFSRQQLIDGLDVKDCESFAAHFYDPYFEDGHLQSRAFSLGGSWMDSGINALSVISRVINHDNLFMRDSRMTRVAGTKCSEVQGTVEFEFSRGTSIGSGVIDTNWTLGRDQKMTTLGFRGSERKIVLNHSTQQVVVTSPAVQQGVFVCQNGLPRLTNHYIGVFLDLERQLAAGKDNFDHCRSLHVLLYEAEDRTGVAVR